MILTILDDGEALLSTILLMVDSIILPKIWKRTQFQNIELYGTNWKIKCFYNSLGSLSIAREHAKRLKLNVYCSWDHRAARRVEVAKTHNGLNLKGKFQISIDRCNVYIPVCW